MVSLPIPTAVITRLLMSPLALYVGGSADDRNHVKAIAEAITIHVSILMCVFTYRRFISYVTLESTDDHYYYYTKIVS